MADLNNDNNDQHHHHHPGNNPTHQCHHGHPPSHGGHVHEHGHNYVTANETHFNDNAANFDAFPHAISRGELSAEAIRRVVPCDENTTVLDFACGTGLVSKNLVSYTKMIVGVDISQGMADAFNKRFADAGFTPEKIRGVRAELKGEEGELDGLKFDIVFCAAAYHHLPDLVNITRILTHFLKPGGSLIVIDLLATDASFEFPKEYHYIVPHRHGFSKGDIEGLFQGAGLDSVTYEKLPMEEGDFMKFFIARGIKLLST